MYSIFRTVTLKYRMEIDRENVIEINKVTFYYIYDIFFFVF